VVHQSVLDRLGCGARLAAGQSPYNPANLSGTYLVGGQVSAGTTVLA